MRGDSIRSLIAREAARLMLANGIRDFDMAKRKAAQKLGPIDRAAMPNNIEIEAEIADYQRLFRSDRQPQKLAFLRESAVQAMQFLADFEPRLTGAVLSGTADEHSFVELHLFADAPEEIALFLAEHNIPYEHGDKRLRLGPDEVRAFPAYGFMAGDAPIELIIMPYRALRRPPLSPVTGKAMARARINKVRRLLEDPAKPEPQLCR
jgi:hypothetical protein